MKEVLFPRTKKFGSVFKRVRKANTVKLLLVAGGTVEIDPVMYVHGRNGARYSFNVVPSTKVLSRLLRSLVVEDTHLAWEAIVRDGGKTLLLLRYNKIIGSRWIAVIDTKTLPRR